jgi:hypothetical protein
MARGKLVVVGTGMRVARRTPEARTSLLTSYAVDRLRTDTYGEMIERMLSTEAQLVTVELLVTQVPPGSLVEGPRQDNGSSRLSW